MVSGADSNYEEAAERFNRVGSRCTDAGITLCYHSHSWEFKDYKGSTGMERLIARTNPADVKLCVDTFWVQHGGRYHIEFIRSHLDRVASLHLKDLKYIGPEPRREGVLAREDAETVELGRGEVDFPAIWCLVEPLRQSWVVYEQDRPTLSPVEASAISRRYMRDRLGI